MTKQFIAAAIACILVSNAETSFAQSNKEKKSRYYQNSEPNQDFNVQGFFIDREKNEVDKKPVEDEYDVKVKRGETDEKYKGEQRVISEEEEVQGIAPATKRVRTRREPGNKEGYYTTYGAYKPYQENRKDYDKYYGTAPAPATTVAPVRNYQTPVVAENEPSLPVEQPRERTRRPRRAKAKARNEVEIKMTDKENEYKTTVVKRRYTNLDVLCDDLDLAKIQRPVFKGICQECANDVDVIITNKNLSSLEKNYQLKTCYMMRDKRLRETLDEDQYKKFLRIKDADEYLLLTKDPELKDGIYN